MKSINTDERKKKAIERSKIWYYANKHRPEVIKGRFDRLSAWRTKYLKRYLLQLAKNRAKHLKLDFDLDISDINIPEECPVLKVPFKFKTKYAMSLDRIDPSKGYVKNNVQIISRKANLMKQDATQQELRNFANWVNTFQV